MGRDRTRPRRAALLAMAAVAVLYVGAASPAYAIDTPEGLNVTDAEGNPVPDINITNAAPGDSEERTWFITLADGAPPTEITYLLTGFRNVEVSCNDPERTLDETCDPEQGEGESQTLAAASGIPGELDQYMSMIVAAGSVAADAVTCDGDGVTVSDNAAPSTYMDDPKGLGDGTLVAGERLCVSVSLALPASATNIVQADQLAFAFLLNTVPAALPPNEEPPNEPPDPTGNPPDPEAPTPPRPEEPIGRSNPRPPLAATGLGIATLLLTGAALVSTGALAVKRSRRSAASSSLT